MRALYSSHEVLAYLDFLFYMTQCMCVCVCVCVRAITQAVMGSAVRRPGDHHVHPDGGDFHLHVPLLPQQLLSHLPAHLPLRHLLSKSLKHSPSLDL